MKAFLSLSIAIIAILSLSAYQNLKNTNVKLLELADKNFTYIFKFDTETSVEEIENAERFLKQYDPAVSIKHSVNQEDGKISLKIKANKVTCSTTDLHYGLILMRDNNQCDCAMVDKPK